MVEREKDFLYNVTPKMSITAFVCVLFVVNQYKAFYLFYKFHVDVGLQVIILQFRFLKEK